ncbi:hypothetical protein H5410_045683 [Solanum commersonii]|uniref:Uncharacterized protein n=1 Tax=Solanum commersonii TaxID=4109 RepID=A0A9J5XA71_SOLCO|nr:hypothetical protein H5410_045683 [Solanum commersonii]
MTLRNPHPSDGFEKNVIHTEITTEQYATKQVVIPKIPLSPPEDEQSQFKFIWKQFPIRLYFVMTINKMHYQMLDYIL